MGDIRTNLENHTSLISFVSTNKERLK